MPRFLADENFPKRSIDLLRDAGHDVAAIRERDRGATDPDVLERASREDRVLLTFDRDFGEMIFLLNLPAPPGIVYFRLDPNWQTDERAVRLQALLRDPNASLATSFTVAMENRSRQRSLPTRLM